MATVSSQECFLLPSTGKAPAPPRDARSEIFFFVTLVTGHRSSLSLKLSDTRVYEPQIRARLGTTAQGQKRPRSCIFSYGYTSLASKRPPP